MQHYIFDRLSLLQFNVSLLSMHRCRLLLKAQLKDAEDKLKELEQMLHPEILCEETDHTDQEGPWSPSSLLSLRRVTMHCGQGEFVAVVGGVGAGKVNGSAKYVCVVSTSAVTDPPIAISLH